MNENVGNLRVFLPNILVERRRLMIKGDLDCSSDFMLAMRAKLIFTLGVYF